MCHGEGTQLPSSIKFNFRPNSDNGSSWGVEKEEGDVKKRYLEGISSGEKLDGELERMTEKAIKSFMDQAEGGQVLLYDGKHGINSVEDVGILNKAKVLPNGDWFTSYRLYDESDGIGQNKLEKIEDIWKQANGFPPYKKPIQKGFSIEGDIPDGGIVSAEDDGEGNMVRRVIDDVKLTGVVLVPKPAYTDSVATAIYKALGEVTPDKAKKLKKNFDAEFGKVLQDQADEENYHRKRWDLQDALERTIENIMRKTNITDKSDQLMIAFDSYKLHMIPQIMDAESIFMDNEEEEAVENNAYIVNNSEINTGLLKNFSASIVKVQKLLKGNIHEKEKQTTKS